mgnify:CR=1 FL=1
MNRRNFVKNSSLALCTLPVVGSLAFQPVAATKKPDWILYLINSNDSRYENHLKNRISDRSNPAYGGFQDSVEIPNPHSTISFVIFASTALICPESKYFKSQKLITELTQALQFLVSIQHSDGTIDLLSTNFHSTPDTAFMVTWVTPLYRMLKKMNEPQYAAPLKPYEIFLRQAGEALTYGGIHTPNHRWVVTAGLTELNKTWPNQKYVDRAEEWLAEKIDLDADGQFTERSTFVYSPLTDRVLLTIAEGLLKPEIFEAVRKNLEMNIYYVHTNGEVVTEASNRQDKSVVGTMEGYYYPYRYLALKDKNPRFSAMCKSIEEAGISKIGSQLTYFLEDESLWKELPKPTELPKSYVKAFPISGLVRVRKNNWDATLISENPVFLTFYKGNAVLQGLRFSASFFGKGQFQTDEIVPDGKNWVLSKSLEGPYYQPFPKDLIPGDGDWEKLSRSKRKQSEIQQFQSNATVRVMETGLEVDIEITGTDGVPVSVELIFREGGELKNVMSLNKDKKSYLLEDGQLGSYHTGTDTIHFGPGLSKHKGVELRGALPKMDAPTVYLTGFTPFKHTLKLS